MATGTTAPSNAYENTVPIAEGLFTWPSNDPRLLGSQCQECAVVTFPAQSGCPACGSVNVKIIELAREGTLWTWTIQGFYPQRPPYDGPETPENFKPFGVGYIELPGQVRVQSRIKTKDVSKLRIGMNMRFLVEKYIERDGKQVMCYFFQPSDEI
ncbi:MAG: OB-fold domain-containing protein [Gammaproteobacteria bacterium]|nr:OB-fold domain-containing protein [Gammaproteobacteria bacterium]MCY4198380.1 OB-fold domain-containing protein [Gammaproteobacteria bacterium]MCY4278836.1 OB-fold domain-containing protein [Gammaproteobacteria bacterium]